MKTVIVMALCLAAAPAAHAERVLGLPDALALARKNNRDLGAARARLRQAEVGIEQAWSALLPTVAAQGKYTHNYKGAVLDLGLFNEGTLALAAALRGANATAPLSAQNPALVPALDRLAQQLAASGPSTVTIQKEEQLDSSVNLSVPLIAPAAWSALASARSQVAASGASFDVTATSLLLSVAQAFYAAAGADELLLAREHAVEVAQKTVSNAQVKLAAGAVKRTDVTQAALALLRAQQALREAGDLRVQAYRSLATLLQLGESFRVAPPPPDAGEGVDPTRIDELTGQALRLRPEVRAYQASVEAYSLQMTAADRRWLPTLSGFGNARLSNYAGFTGDKYAWAVGLQLDWVIYDAGARQAQLHLASAQREEDELHVLAESDQVRDEIRTAGENLKTKGAALTTAVQSEALAQETLDLTRAEYDAGTATQLDVLQAQDALVAAEVSQAQAHFDLALAKISLERAAGSFPEAIP